MKGIFSIPSEIVLKILQLSTIEDSRNVARACIYNHTLSDKLVRCYNDRVSIRKYLSNHFGNGDQIIRLMSKYYAVICGSRALEYFVPGSSTQDSDWDIYIGSYPAVKESMMKDLEKMGVEWETSIEKLIRLVMEDNRKVSIPDFAMNIMLSVKTESKQERVMRNMLIKLIDLHKDTIDHLNRRVANWVFDNYDGRLRLTVNGPIPQQTNRDDSYGRLVVARGFIQRNGKTVYIDLVTAENHMHYACHKTVIAFHSTQIQCFITHLGAFHGYGKLSNGRKSIFWKENATTPSVRKKAEIAVTKYRSRGYSYIPNPKSVPKYTGNFRTMSDQHCTVVRPSEIGVELNEEDEFHMAELAQTAWYEFEDRVVSIESAADILRHTNPWNSDLTFSNYLSRENEDYMNRYTIVGASIS